MEIFNLWCLKYVLWGLKLYGCRNKLYVGRIYSNGNMLLINVGKIYMKWCKLRYMG